MKITEAVTKSTHEPNCGDLWAVTYFAGNGFSPKSQQFICYGHDGERSHLNDVLKMDLCTKYPDFSKNSAILDGADK